MSHTKIYSWLAVCLLLVLSTSYFNRKYEVMALTPFHSGTQHDLSVMTWNIHCPDVSEGEKQRRIAALILKEDAEIVLLNEFTMDSCRVIDSLMSMRYPYTNDARARGKTGDIFYSKIPLAESGKFKFKGFRKTVYSKINIGADSVYIFGCHLAGNNSKGQIEIDDADSLQKVKTFWGRYRRAQEKRNGHAHLLKEIIMENSLPMIVMGDMNDFQHSAPMDSLRDAGMKNAWWEGGDGYGATYHQGLLRLRIDHIYYNEKLKLESIKVIETKLSDHNPVVAGFSFIEK